MMKRVRNIAVWWRGCNCFFDMDIYKIIDDVVQNMATKIEKEGIAAIKAGNNGPYYDKETNVRNMAHWCVTFSEYYLHTKDDRYKELVIKLADEIMNSEYYNGNGVYKCRESEGKDDVNGVIGPAWIIQGLVYAYDVTGDASYLDRAYSLYDAVAFDDKLGLWIVVDTNNNKRKIDLTFNHQLWFAAAISMINKKKRYSSIEKELDLFVKQLPKNAKINRYGRIRHFTSNKKFGVLSGIVRFGIDLASDVLELLNLPSLAYKESGYHIFNLYGFAILKDNYSTSIEFLETKKYRKALDYLTTARYEKMIDTRGISKDLTHVSTKLTDSANVFAYAYNSPAFELPYVCKIFNIFGKNMQEITIKFAKKQLDNTYDAHSNTFANNTDDPLALTARVYEILVGNDEYFECLG